MRADLIFEAARYVVVCDDASTVLADASVAVSNGRIVAVGPTEQLRLEVAADEVIDARGHLIIPGLINLHTHLPMTLTRADPNGVVISNWRGESRASSE